ncbi:hypothetical protein SAMN05444422_11476 [Halobiforma haloterrestris]|uniref:Uncharacterized protein n=1 Tax=Natronobacterium haloterrestre TaxID=148448 RepID=A0A1I1L515_NATHA|nr:hypothetical protein [Halobiforma haloterrestris]SFC68124.1 hypothetical protein SAMN05444422_11476 [Halobiforma haloterrestris]
MTGFKEGASGDNPFGAGTEDDKAGEDDVDGLESMGSSVEVDPQPDRAIEQQDGRDESDSSRSGLPWIYERDSITDGRAKTVQLHLQDTTLDRQRQVKSDVEGELGESVKKADLREAALLVGLKRIDDVADQLREWGYDFE